MAVKKSKLRKSVFYILSKDLREKRKKSKRRKACAKGFFQDGKNKGTYHQTLQNMHVSDREDRFSYMIA